MGRTVIEAARLTFRGHPNATFDRDTIANIPYATIAAKIGRGPRSLLVLWRIDQEGLLWLSADNAAIVTRSGRVIETAGLPETMRSTRSITPDPLVNGPKDLQSAEYDREIDFGRNESVDVARIVSSFSLVGDRTIEIEDIEFKTILYRERCSELASNWNFENHYWVDPIDGFVWKSRQHIAKSFPSIEIEVLKPAA